jgi:carbamoyl-phosphate synthase small subunit
MKNSNPAILLLEDGTIFKGKAFGKIGTATGEITFNTSMTGYQESLTDPSYYGQILVATSPHVGNYGVLENELKTEEESDAIKVEGLVVKEYSDYYSRSSATCSIDDYLIKYQKVGIYGVDTRELTQHIRKNGAMKAIISSECFDLEQLKKMVDESPDMNGLELSSKVSTQTAYDVLKEEALYKVAVIDFGIKKNILRELSARGLNLRVFPMNVTMEELMRYEPDGFMLSNGPGDPSVMLNSQQLIREIVASGIPTFGICLGHQLLGLSQGLKTEKMHNGHRGANHPVKNIKTGKCEMTSQNHGFVITRESIENHPTIELTHYHLNDLTVSGIALKNKPVFSVQYHPEASPGPHDSKYLFDDFIQLIQQVKQHSQI